jgi:hypothetical protein
LPAVVVDRLHILLVPRGLCRRAPRQTRANLVVAVGKQVRFDHEHVTDDALGRETTSVHLRRDVLDHGSTPTLVRQS